MRCEMLTTCVFLLKVLSNAAQLFHTSLFKGLSIMN